MPILRVVLHEGKSAQDTPAGFLRVFENASRERGDAHVFHVQVALCQGLEPARVFGEQLLDDLEFLLQDRKLAAGGGVQLDGGNHRAAGDRDGHVSRTSFGDVVQEDREPAVPRRRPARSGGVHETEVRDALRVAQQARGTQDALTGGYFGDRGQTVRAIWDERGVDVKFVWASWRPSFGTLAGRDFIFYSCRVYGNVSCATRVRRKILGSCRCQKIVDHDQRRLTCVDATWRPSPARH